jgi:hypothetical protein
MAVKSWRANWGGLVQQVAEVDEMFLAGGTLVAGVGAPFGDEALGGHDSTLAGGCVAGEGRGWWASGRMWPGAGDISGG